MAIDDVDDINALDYDVYDVDGYIDDDDGAIYDASNRMHPHGV